MFPKDENGKFYYDDTDYVETWKVNFKYLKCILIRAVHEFAHFEFARPLGFYQFQPIFGNFRPILLI